MFLTGRVENYVPYRQSPKLSVRHIVLEPACWTLVLKQMVVNPIKNYLSKYLARY